MKTYSKMKRLLPNKYITRINILVKMYPILLIGSTGIYVLWIILGIQVNADYMNSIINISFNIVQVLYNGNFRFYKIHYPFRCNFII